MSITRSQIARQLLAEGGAPRSPGNTTLQRVLPRMDGIRPGFYGPDMGEGGKESDFGLSDYSTSDVDFGGESGGTRQEFRDTAKAIGTPKTPSRADNFRANQLKKQLDLMYGNTRLSPSFIASLLRGPAVDVYNQDFLGANQEMEDVVGLDQYGMSGKDLTRSQNIQDALDKGIVTQSDFEKAFYGPGGKPPKGEGGDSEPIKKLKAPITEKIEEPKGEFDDILQFYGAKFARGGRTDAESQYGADSAGSYSYSDDGNRDDDGGGPPTAMGGGEPPMLSGGRGIDVGALQKQGLTPNEIAAVYGDYYGIDTTPTVAGPLGTGLGGLMDTGPLGTGPGGLMDTGPSIEFGQQVTKGPGTTGTTGTGFDVKDVQPTSGYGGAKDVATGKALADFLKEAGPDFLSKADGGEVRQGYFGGSIVKGIKKGLGAVKKIAKSPIGKAALFAGLGTYGLGVGPFGASGAFSKAKGAGFLRNFLLKDAAKKFALDNINPFGAITAASLLAGGLSKQDEEEEETIQTARSDPEFQKYLSFYGGPRRFAEEGGDIDEAPMKMASNMENDAILENLYEAYLDLGFSPEDAAKRAKEEFDRMSKKRGIQRTTAAMGGMMEQDEMLNLDGNEMDLRGGGFVPLGEYEKKDDVPARLSKNEFVMTADAVRAAGGGSVDRGADIMYKTMKTLENKVA